MRQRTYHTPFNLLLEPEIYQRLKMISRLKHVPMSKFIREGIDLRLINYDKENDALIPHKEDINDGCSDTK